MGDSCSSAVMHLCETEGGSVLLRSYSTFDLSSLRLFLRPSLASFDPSPLPEGSNSCWRRGRGMRRRRWWWWKRWRMSGLSQLPPPCCRSPPIISFLLRFEQVFPDLGSALLSVQLFYFDNINHSYLLLALRVKASAHFLTHHAKTLLLSWIFFLLTLY